jgi:hypothetical protein
MAPFKRRKGRGTYGCFQAFRTQIVAESRDSVAFRRFERLKMLTSKYETSKYLRNGYRVKERLTSSLPW